VIYSDPSKLAATILTTNGWPTNYT